MSSEEGFLGLKVGSLDLKAPVFVGEGTTVAEAARAMRAARATACLVGDPAKVAGILTERDVVGAVADGRNLECPVAEIMSRAVLGVSREDLVSEAFLVMIRHGIRRLVVRDNGGSALTMLEERDLMAARVESPVAISAAISSAGNARTLAQAYAGLGELLPTWLKQGANVNQAGALAAAVRDQLFVRAAELALLDGPDPGPFSLVVLGSEGRREQFLATDQDNAIVLDERADSAKAEDFAKRLMSLLRQSGLPPCPHGVTADNASWRMSLDSWRAHLGTLGRDLGSNAVLALSLLADVRHVFGVRELTSGLRQEVLHAVRENPRCLRYMAREAVRFEPPLTVFGGLSTEGAGAGRGGLDIKRGGIFPLTQGARVLALEFGMERTDTASRLKGAALAGVLSRETADDLSQSLEFMQELRLRFQAEALAGDREPDSLVYPERLTKMERSRLRDSFKAVIGFQAILSNKYALHLLT